MWPLVGREGHNSAGNSINKTPKNVLMPGENLPFLYCDFY